MNDAKIRLGMIKQAAQVNRFGQVSLEIRDETVFVEFVAPNGRSVSVAFDGRPDSEGIGSSMAMSTYRTFSDCPVIDADDRQSGPVSDLEAMQILRDSLIAMNLGDCNEQ